MRPTVKGGTPEPGTPGNSIIGGHRDTSLAFLERVAVGERLIIETADGARITYHVTDTLWSTQAAPGPAPKPPSAA